MLAAGQVVTRRKVEVFDDKADVVIVLDNICQNETTRGRPPGQPTIVETTNEGAEAVTYIEGLRGKPIASLTIVDELLLRQTCEQLSASLEYIVTPTCTTRVTRVTEARTIMKKPIPPTVTLTG